MKRKNLMTKILGTVGTGIALTNRFPNIKKKIPDVDKMLSNAGLKRKNRVMRSMITMGILGFSLARLFPMSRNFIRQR